MEKKSNTQYASIKEYAQKYNLPEIRIRDYIKCGKIPNVIRGNKKQYLIPFDTNPNLFNLDKRDDSKPKYHPMCYYCEIYDLQYTKIYKNIHNGIIKDFYVGKMNRSKTYFVSENDEWIKKEIEQIYNIKTNYEPFVDFAEKHNLHPTTLYYHLKKANLENDVIKFGGRYYIKKDKKYFGFGVIVSNEELKDFHKISYYVKKNNLSTSQIYRGIEKDLIKDYYRKNDYYFISENDIGLMEIIFIKNNYECFGAYERKHNLIKRILYKCYKKGCLKDCVICYNKQYYIKKDAQVKGLIE